MGFLAAILPLLGGVIQPIKDWLSYKRDMAKAKQDYELALLQGQIEQVKQEISSASDDLKTRLSSTSQKFKQDTFWFLTLPIIFTMVFPKYAMVMWDNFSHIPPMFQYLFEAVYSSIWGLPIAKDGYNAFTNFLSSRQDYKLEIKKAKYNHKAVFDALRVLYPNGYTQAQVNVIEKALSAGEIDGQ